MAEPFLKAFLVGDAEVIQTLTALPDQARPQLVKTIGRLAIELQGHVVRDYLSGQALKTRTGTLRRSITYAVTDAGQDVHAIVGTNVRYARIWEFGGIIPAHDRTISKVFGRELANPVTGHWKARTIAPRSFLRPALKDNAQNIRDEIRKAVLSGVKS